MGLREGHSPLGRLVLLALFALAVGCQDFGQPSDDDILNFTGTIIEETVDFYVIHSDTPFQNSSTFYPLNLPNSFKRDGLRIRFSGRVEISPNAQYLHLPLKISAIEALPR